MVVELGVRLPFRPVIAYYHLCLVPDFSEYERHVIV